MLQKRIGFVDYDLDNFHANTFLRIIRNDLSQRGFTVSGCHALCTDAGKTWAEKNNINYYSTPEELNEAVDFYIILAPSNPELHLKLCKTIFPFGKTSYVDKTFAPDYDTAEKIFTLAEKYKIKIQTSSALRYTEVKNYVKDAGGQSKIKHMIA